MNEPTRGEWTSASNALADRLCQGRYQAQLDLPELPSSEECEAGQVIHALWTGGDPQSKPTPEQRDKADALLEQEKEVANQFFGKTEGLVRIVERRLWHEFKIPGADSGERALKTSGQFDVAWVDPRSRRALLFDGKSGWLPVSPNESNLQLRRLAALLWLQLGSEAIGVCILKPFARAEPVCVYTVADLEVSVSEMEQDVVNSHAPWAPRTAGEEQCRYCRAREVCSTRLEWLAAALPAPVSSSVPLASARDWTPGQRVTFLEREKEVRDWLETRKEEIKILLAEDPGSVPGYGLKPGHNVETITDHPEVFNRFCRDLGGTPQAFIHCIKVGKTALKEAVRALSGHKGKALESAVAKLLAGCVEVKPSVPTIEKVGWGINFHTPGLS